MRPGSVRATRRASRLKRATPRLFSRSAIWWLTADWVTASSSAAARKLRWRAAASKARRAVREGGGGVGMDEDISSVGEIQSFDVGRQDPQNTLSFVIPAKAG